MGEGLARRTATVFARVAAMRYMENPWGWRRGRMGKREE
jgi:hypothetical protein